MLRKRFLFKITVLLSALLVSVAARAADLEGELLWSRKFGSGYAGAPSAVLVDGDFLYTSVGKRLYRLNRFSGEVLAVSDEAAASVGYGINPPTLGGGMIFVPIRGGRVQAFDADTLAPLWSTPALGGQSLSPVCFGDDKIFFGTWLGEKENGCFCAYSVTKNGCELLWSLEHKGGFYRMGALYRDKKVIFGSDNGSDGEGRSVLYTADAESGRILETIDSVEGDIRSSIVDYDGGCVFSTKAGYLCRVKDGELFCVKVGTECAATPAIAATVAYQGTLDKELVAVDLESMKVIGRLKAVGYPNGGVAVRGGRVYTTCNALPGGVYAAKQSGGELEAVFLPEGDMAQYGISPIEFGEDGILYYKNDSGNIFAVRLWAQARVEAPEKTNALLMTFGVKTGIERILLEKGVNTVKIPADGGRAFIWSESLAPLVKEIWL